MKDSRTLNTSRNIASGLLNQLVRIILPFVNRTILIYTLGAAYAGIGSLFLSILSVLSIAELGFNSAVVYSMYKPMAEGDHEKICELLTIIKKIYICVGSAILFGGLVLMVFLPHFIGGEIPEDMNIYVLYLLYLFDSAVGYFLFSYRESILLAAQRRDISNMVRTAVQTLQYILQACVLLIFKSFYLYLGVKIVSTVLTSYQLYRQTKKYFPEYQCIPNSRFRIPSDIKKKVSALLINNICDQARNSFDSIILSSLMGLTAVAVYNNYYFIYSALYGIVLTICNSMGASVGNSIATESAGKNYEDLQKFSFMAMWVFGWMSICMLCLYQPFMKLWVGEKLMLSNTDMGLFCAYFVFININNIRNQYINGAGLWNHLKLSYLIEAASNVALNLILGKLFGITGIICATIITILLMNFIWRTYILFQTYFKQQSLSNFLAENVYWVLCIIFTGILTFKCCSFLRISPLASIFSNGLICIVLPNLLFWMLFCWTKQYKAARHFVLRLINKN